MYVIAFFIVFRGLTRSPHVAMAFLIISAVWAGTRLGFCGIIWPFFVIRIVFVGGIIVLFIYITRLINSSNIRLLIILITPLTFLLITGVLVWVSFIWFIPARFLWVRECLNFSLLRLVLFLVLYLLVSLLTVCRLCQKNEGPIKSLIKI